MNKLGIIQGRLSEPLEGFQRCPKNWQREFELLDSLSLSHVEWIVVSEDYESNPIFQEIHVDLDKVSGVCLDNLVDDRIDNPEFLDHNLRKACDTLRKRGVKHVAVPLLEKSSLENNASKFNNFLSLLKEYSDEYKDMTFLLETEMSLDKVVKLCNVSSNVKVTYDTGNTTSFGISHEDFINVLFDRIENIHLKDRTKDAVSKPPTQGDTDFHNIFKILKKKNYDKIYTLQTMREKSGLEVSTIRRHIKVLKEIYDRA